MYVRNVKIKGCFDFPKLWVIGGIMSLFANCLFCVLLVLFVLILRFFGVFFPLVLQGHESERLQISKHFTTPTLVTLNKEKK